MRDMATTIPPLSRSDVEGAGILLTSVVNSHPPDPFDPFTSLKANQDECFKLSIIFYARYDGITIVHLNFVTLTRG